MYDVQQLERDMKPRSCCNRACVIVMTTPNSDQLSLRVKLLLLLLVRRRHFSDITIKQHDTAAAQPVDIIVAVPRSAVTSSVRLVTRMKPFTRPPTTSISGTAQPGVL